MPHITKHDSEFKGEGNTGEDSRVNFFVRRNTVSIYNFLEGPDKLINSEERGRFSIMV